MGLNFIKKKETIILLVIVIGILALIGWFFLDTLRLTPPEPKTVENKDAGGSGRVVRKKIGTPQVETSTAAPSTTPTAAPDNVAGDENKPLAETVDQPDEPSATTPEDQPLAKADDAAATEPKPSDAPEAPSDAETGDADQPDEPATKPAIPEDAEEATQPTDQTPEEDSADAPATEKSDDGQVADASTPATTDKTDTEKEPESSASTSESADMDLRMREPGRPYSIKLASIRQKAHAQQGLKELKNDKTDPFIARLDLGAERGVWWNIYTGHFETKEAALEVWKTLDMPDTHIKKLSYANLIGEFDSQDEMASEYQRLEEKGYHPYVVRDGDKWRLFVGDFLYKEGAAERNQKRLQADGFSGEIVER